MGRNQKQRKKRRKARNQEPQTPASTGGGQMALRVKAAKAKGEDVLVLVLKDRVGSDTEVKVSFDLDVPHIGLNPR